MGNIEIHDLEPVREDERHELDLSVPVDYRAYCKHINGEYSYKCLTELPYAVRDSISLHERMNVAFNCLTTLPAELPLRLPHLSFINLSYNKISTLPESIGLLFHLKEVLLMHNLLKSIPSSITRLVKLQKIDLSHNLLEELPENMGKMESLRKLNLSHNNLKSLPKSLGCCKTLEILLASNNKCETQPPQSICDSGSDKTLKFLKQLFWGKMIENPNQELNVFPRIRSNIAQTTIPNPDSARALYIQKQTQTMNTACRIRTPLLPPYNATQMHPEELKDRIIGLIYGAVIGDALGIATEFLTLDECRFHYDENNLKYSDIIQDEHRVHWAKGDWTSNSDQMLLVLDSLLQWAGVVDELEFAKRLVSWKRSGIPELGKRESYMFSTTINLVLQVENYNKNPHQVAKSIHQNAHLNQVNGTSKNDNNRSPLFVDSGALPRSLILGIPRFHDLNEVVSNSLRICLATHTDESCLASCVSLSVILALILQGKYSSNDESCLKELIKISSHYGATFIKDEKVKEEFYKCFECKDFDSVGICEAGKVCHTFKPLSTAFVALRQDKDFRHILSSVLMYGGYSSMIGCISGAVLGCKYGFSHLPKNWVEGLNPKNTEWLNSKINALLDMMGLP